MRPGHGLDVCHLPPGIQSSGTWNRTSLVLRDHPELDAESTLVSHELVVNLDRGDHDPDGAAGSCVQLVTNR